MQDPSVPGSGNGNNSQNDDTLRKGFDESTDQQTDDMRVFLRYWLPLITWCAFIFIQSAFATPDVVPHWRFMDKLLHTGGYALLGFLFCRALNRAPRLRDRACWLMVLGTLLTGLYGVSDEWHQSFVPARTADVLDVAADLAGGMIGSALFVLFLKYRNRSVLIDKIALFI